jgi:hypothetical protein
MTAIFLGRSCTMPDPLPSTHRHSPRARAVITVVTAAAMVCAACTGAPSPTGRPSPISTTGSASAVPLAPASVVPDPAHVAVLDAVASQMQREFGSGKQQSPGAADILDYDIGALWRQGIDGTGATIALLEAWDDPSISTQMDAFDSSTGLPPVTLQTIYPSGDGQLPASCPTSMQGQGDYGTCVGWAGEELLDVETAHLIAPYAHILLAITPPDSEVVGDIATKEAPPEMMQGVEYIAAHHLADAISISGGTGEASYAGGGAEIHAQDPAELTAAADGVPLLVGTGDCGALQNLPTATGQCTSTSTAPDTSAWAASPWVTAVGGSRPNLTASGAHAGPDQVWDAPPFAEGAGLSADYPRPAYQDAVASATGSSHRSLPDLVMDAQSGTSEATPMLAAVLALAGQLDHAPLGPINDALYQVLGPHGAADGITDVTSGSNAVSGAPGFSAKPGFDVATGWGTVDAAKFVPALVATVRAQHGATSPADQAAAALTKQRDAARLATADVPAGTSTTLTASGFLPGHPVTVSIDGRQITTATADASGEVLYALNPSALRLAAGAHTLTLNSMLLTQKVSFQSR